MAENNPAQSTADNSQAQTDRRITGPTSNGGPPANGSGFSSTSTPSSSGTQEKPHNWDTYSQAEKADFLHWSGDCTFLDKNPKLVKKPNEKKK